MLSLYTPYEAQMRLAHSLRKARKRQKHSREKASELSGVPAPTLRRFEVSGEISLGQLLMLVSVYGQLDEVDRLFQGIATPSSIRETVEAEIDASGYRL